MNLSNSKNINSRKLCYVVNNAAFFVSHRLPIAIEAIKSGYSVYLIIGKPGSLLMETAALKIISDLDIRLIKSDFSSDGLNPIIEAFHFLRVFLKIKAINPEVIHCISPKGILYGGISAKILKKPKLVLAITGMGFLFTGSQKKNQTTELFKFLYKLILKFILSHTNKTIIVQNRDDHDFILAIKNVSKSEISLISGSGVNLRKFSNVNFENKIKIVLFPARILKDKGALEFVNAARQLRSEFPEWKFIMAGTADYANPSKISEFEIKKWVSEELIEWLGHVNDMTDLYLKTSIVCLPSYREGMPKALLEAAAAGCAVVTTNSIGCRDAIIPNFSGLLVPVADATALANALRVIMIDDSLRIKFGRTGIKLARERYEISSVIYETLRIYDNKK